MQENSKDILLKYDGNNKVDAVDLATSILSFSKVIHRIGKDYIPEDKQIKIDIYSFEEGSLDAPMCIEIINSAQVCLDGGLIQNIGMISAAIVPSIDKILSNIVDLITLVQFLGGKKPKQIKPDVNNSSSLQVENNQGQIKNFQNTTIMHYHDHTTYNYIVKTMDPIKNAENLSGLKIFEKNGDEYAQITEIKKEDMNSFVEINDNEKQNIEIIGIMTRLDSETKNGKISYGESRIPVSFGPIFGKADYYVLCDSYKYRSPIKIKGIATFEVDGIDIKYKNIDIISSEALQKPLIEIE